MHWKADPEEFEANLTNFGVKQTKLVLHCTRSSEFIFSQNLEVKIS